MSGRNRVRGSSRLIPHTVLALLIMLAALLIVGCVAPMTYLSAQSGDSKGWILWSFAALAVGVVAVLAIEVARIRSARHLHRDNF